MVILGAVLAHCLASGEQEEFRIALDPSLRPEAVQVYYFLLGEFGGYGDFNGRAKATDGEILLPVYRNGQRATSLKAVLYARGCEVTTVSVMLAAQPPGASRVRFTCLKLGTVWLRGAVTGHPHPSELNVQLRYLAHWSHKFFGIGDGPVLSLAIANVAPDRDGRFAVEVPDFANDGVTNSYNGQAEWSVTAGTAGTNDQYWLNAGKQANRPSGTLTIEREYPKELQFRAQHF
jgi:hypothetical protein